MPQIQDKPLPSIPSPTLSSISNILPQTGPRMPDSPESMRRPPSLSYLRDYQDAGANRDREQQQQQAQPKKEKRGLMSRKMMLLRSRTASSKKYIVQTGQEHTSQQNFPPRQDSLENPVTIPSSPTIYDGDRLAPQTTNSTDKRSSIGASSYNSEESVALPEFLSRYRSREETEDEETDTEKPAQPPPMGYSVSIAGGPDAERRAQEEEEERNSAMLSQRAEQILANAKKRLNLMEGNLRGARDLVQPLTTANLKRATSLGSSHQQTVGYGGKRFLMDGYTNTRPGRTLHVQTSTPSLGREYHQGGHGRTRSDLALPERPHTALARGDMFGRKGRIPVRPSNSSWTDLRGSRSFESLGGSDFHVQTQSPLPARESPAVMGTPDPDLGPLPEESASQVAPSVRERDDDYDQDRHRDSSYTESGFEYGLGITRSPSTTEGLKEQMSSLKGRISSLRDRAKEDSIRRQGYHLRDSSPLNNAEYQPPEMWYSGASDSPMETRPHEHENSPSKNVQGGGWGSLPLKTGSRNAFAEMAARQNGSLTLRERRMQHRETHHGHRYTGSRDMPGSFDIGDNEIRSEGGTTPGAESYQHSASDAPTLSTPDNPSEYFLDFDDNESVYEDAEPDLPSSVVPHEQREDAFDYEHFFLHSAMARYQQSSSPVDSDMESVSSTSTAKGPAATPRAPQHDMRPPETPETPEQLREIERKIAHSRSQSSDSVSTTASFATAAEQHGRASPSPGSVLNTSSSKPSSRRSSRAASRPSSTDPTPSLSRPSISTNPTRRPPSETSTSLPNRRTSNLRRSQALSSTNMTPLTSPLLSSQPVQLQDPTAVAVNALLDPQGRCVGLKDKALVFGVVESLRRVCEGLQLDGDGEGEGEWRRRLEGCRRVLEGEGE